MYRIFQSLAQAKVMIPWALIVLGIFAFLTSPLSPVQTLNQISHNSGILDEKPFASTETVLVLKESYGKAGTDFYMQSVFIIDSFLPLIINGLIILTLFALLRHLGLFETKFRHLLLLPLIGTIADYLENIVSAIILHNTNIDFLASSIGIIVGIKFIFNFGALLSLVVLSLISLYRFIKRSIEKNAKNLNTH